MKTGDPARLGHSGTDAESRHPELEPRPRKGKPLNKSFGGLDPRPIPQTQPPPDERTRALLNDLSRIPAATSVLPPRSHEEPPRAEG